MQPDRYERIEALFHEALERAPAERRRWLEKSCADSPELLEEVNALLEAASSGRDAVAGAIDSAVQLLPRDFDPINPDRAGVPPEDDLLGKRVGPYQIASLIGHGGMGSVYLAKRAEHDFEQTVAIKVVRRGASSEEIVERFRRERRILSQLQHPNIARLLDGGLTGDGLPYFAMEYVDGERIDHYCDRHRLDVDDRLRLFLTACEAVAHAQQNLIVHRDLKPSNILVTDEGVVKLLDFGIAKMIDPEQPAAEEAAVLTSTGQQMVTPAYGSPEQLLGQPVTTASDVFALGVLLYELLSGRRPHQSANDTPAAVIRSILDGQISQPSTTVRRLDAVARNRHTNPARLRKRLSGDLDNICLKALRTEPERRYPSVAELAADIRRHLAGHPVSARGDSPGYRFRKFMGRNRAAVVASGIGLLVVIALVAGHSVQLRAERDRARLEGRKAAEIADFMRDLFGVSDPGRSRGETVTARELLDRGADRLDRELAGEPEIQADLQEEIGRVYASLGLFTESAALLESSLHTRQAILGHDHPDVAQAMDALGDVRRELGDFAEAEELLSQALRVHQAKHGESSPEVARTTGALAVLYTDLGRFDEAEAAYRRAMETWRDLGHEPEHATALANLAQLLHEGDDFETPLPLFMKALGIQRRLYPEGHPELATTLYNLAQLRRDRGELDLAEPLAREALALDRRLFGDEHPNVAHSLSSLALILREQGRYREGEDLLRDALRIRRGVYGETHGDVASAYGKLARNLHDQGRFEEAEAMLRTAVEVARSAFGPDHPAVATRWNDLGWILRDLDRGEEALRVHRDALNLNIRSRGEESFGAAISLGHIARDLMLLGRYAEAESTQVLALARARSLFHAPHPFIATNMAYLGRIRLERGNIASADSLVGEALEMLTMGLGEDNARVWGTMALQAAIRHAQGDVEAARRLYEDVLERQEERLGADHPLTARTRLSLARVLLDAGNTREALPLLEGSYRVLRQSFPPDHHLVREAGALIAQSGE